MKSKLNYKILLLGTFITLMLTSCASSGSSNGNQKDGDSEAGVFYAKVPQDTRTVFYCLVSSAENSSLDYAAQYAYIEDIHDGRGYTAGIIGFTSGTGDLLEVVRRYATLKPKDNELTPYIPALEAVDGTASHKGLGAPFVAAWKEASLDKEMIRAQDSVVNDMYLNPALETARKDGLGTLGAFIYYDALVVHGPGDDEDSFGGIWQAAVQKAATPAQGGTEREYLLAFLSARSVVMKKEAAHSDLSRIDAQRKFIAEENWNLSLPLSWTMYGDDFSLEEQK